MKRKVAIFFAALLITSLSTSVVVHAHTGGTDSQGGHHNRSTGEYHFHHGYPAHQHTNGVCPYNFDDKTGANSGDSENAAVKSTQASTSKTSSSSKEVNTKSQKTARVFWVCVFIVVLWFFYKSIRSHREEKKKAIEMYTGKSISEVAEVPKPYSMDFDGKLYFNGQPTDAGKIMTVYISNNGACYHSPSCKTRTRNMYEIELHKAIQMKYRQCRSCNATGSYPLWYREYKRINAIRKKYKISMKP